MIIGFDPIDKQDVYIDIVKRIFNDLDCEIVDFNTQIFCASSNMDVAYLNWFENMPHKKTHRNLMSFIKRLAILGWLKVKHIPIIYVAHNLSLHNSSGAFFGDILIRLCLKNATIVGKTVEETENMFKLHCGENNTKYINYMLLSIPNYEVDSVYRPNTQIIQDGHRLKVINFGMVRPYKNIEAIISLAKKFKQVDFRVVGCATKGYQAELRRLAAGVDNLSFRFEFLSDADLNQEILNSDLVLLPYHKESMLNSGALRLASILGRSVICPIIGNSYELDWDGYYFYDYSSDEEHLACLQTCFSQVVNDYTVNPQIIVKKGENARKQHLEKYNYERIKRNYAEALNMISDRCSRRDI